MHENGSKHQKTRPMVATLSVVLLLSGVIEAQGQPARPPLPERWPAQQSISAEAEPPNLQTEVIEATISYRESLEKLLVIYEEDLQRLTQRAEQVRAHAEKGYVSKREVENSEWAVSTRKANITEAKLNIARAEMLITEAEANRELLKLPPLPKGGYSETAALIRFDGRLGWVVDNSPRIERFFIGAFGHPLPVSAMGQTAVHDRMGFDHRNAMDIALHPDSREGKALMEYLRNAAVPFMAFRRTISGRATGAHIHIGPPSLRMSVTRQ